MVFVLNSLFHYILNSRQMNESNNKYLNSIYYVSGTPLTT